MQNTTKSWKSYFFEDQPLFGLDISRDKLRVMQFDLRREVPRLKGYGLTSFEAAAIIDDVVVKPELIAKATLKMFKEGIHGEITTKRVAAALPTNRALTRVVQLPKLSPKDIDDAIQTEVEQYIPVHADNLYLDYSILREDENGIEIFVVAMPKKIVDSYIVLTKILGFEPVLFDTVVGASANLFARDKQSDIPSVLIDFGAIATDISVFSHGIVVTGTVAFGGDNLTEAVARTLKITPSEAAMLKSEYGLSASVFQKQIMVAVGPSLDLLMREIRRTIRYYEQRYSKEQPIGQVVIVGGGATMPGLVDFLTERLLLPARTFDPTAHIDFGRLHSFYNVDYLSFVTAAGLAITNPAEIFA